MWLRKTESLEEKTEEMTEGIWERGVRSFWRWWGISVFTNVFPARASSNLCCLLFVTYLWVQSMWSEPLWCEFESVLPPLCDLFMSTDCVKRGVRVRVCVASSLWLDILRLKICAHYLHLTYGKGVSKFYWDWLQLKYFFFRWKLSKFSFFNVQVSYDMMPWKLHVTCEQILPASC